MHKGRYLKCEVCGIESHYLDEVCYYDINGNPYETEHEIENNSNNRDALAHVLCVECGKNKFES